MKILDIIKKYSIFKKATLQLFSNADFTEMDILINSIKKFKDYDICDFKEAIDSIDIKKLKNNLIKDDKLLLLDDTKKIIDNDIYILDKVLDTLGVSNVDFNNIEMSTIDEIEAKDLLTKNQLLILANRIGITKKVFKTKTDLFKEIKKNILNRDVINNIESLLKPPNN